MSLLRSSHAFIPPLLTFPDIETHVLYCLQMYRRPKFLEVLLEIRREMAHEVDYDTDLFAEMIRTGRHTENSRPHSLALPPEKSGAKRGKGEPSD